MPASSQAPRGPLALLAGLRRELSVPLYRNAYALMANTAGNSVLGLLYWVLAARTFPDAAVGRGNALISLMMLVSTFTQLNWSGALIRFLPRAGRSARQMLLTAYVMATGLAAVAAAAVMAYCHFARAPGRSALRLRRCRGVVRRVDGGVVGVQPAGRGAHRPAVGGLGAAGERASTGW